MGILPMCITRVWAPQTRTNAFGDPSRPWNTTLCRAKMALRLGPQTQYIAFGNPLMGKMPMLR